MRKIKKRPCQAPHILNTVAERGRINGGPETPTVTALGADGHLK
jgi:hypothetical protein